MPLSDPGRPPRLRRLRTGGLAYLVVATVLGIAIWPAWVTVDRLVVGGDVLLIHYPWFVLWRDALATGEFPFWNPYTFSGIPAFATLQAGYGYPIHWLLTPLPPILAVNWAVGLHVVIAGVGATWAAGRLGAGREGQILSGLCYALGSAMVARMWAGHLSFLEANAWLPFATGLALHIRGRRSVIWLALVIGLMTLAGQPEVVVFSLWWLPLWAALGAVGSGRRAVIEALVRTALAVALGGGLAAFQLLPVLEVLAVSNRQTRMEWEFRTAASLPGWHLFELFGPLVFGDPRERYWPGPTYEWHERLLYVGIVPLVAAVLAPGRWRWICGVAVGIVVAFAAGGYAPWYPYVEMLPGYASLRIPSKHLTLAALGLALAAGVGLERVRGLRAAGLAFATAFMVACVGATMERWIPPVASIAGGAELLRGVAWRQVASAGLILVLPAVALLLVVAMLAVLPSGRWRGRLLLALAAAELVLVLQPFRLRRADPEWILADAAAIGIRQSAAVIGYEGIAIANYGPVLKIRQPGGYVSLFSGEYMTLLTGRSNAKVEIEVERSMAPFLALLGYEALIDRQGSRTSVQSTAPRQAWVARCSWPGGATEVRARDFPRELCVTRRSATGREPRAEPGSAEIVAEGLGWVTIDADGPGWLVTTRPWYPGWAAESGGRALTVEPVDGALTGVALGPGRHSVTLRYWPAGLTLGLSLSALSVLGLVALWLLGRHRRDTTSAWRNLASF